MCLPFHHSTLYLPPCLFTQLDLLKPPSDHKVTCLSLLCFALFSWPWARGHAACMCLLHLVPRPKCQWAASRPPPTSTTRNSNQTLTLFAKGQYQAAVYALIFYHAFWQTSFLDVHYIDCTYSSLLSLTWHPKWKKTSSQFRLGIWA